MANTTFSLPFSSRLLFIFAFPLAIWIVVSLISVVTLKRTLESYEYLDTSQRVLQLANDFRNLPELLRSEERTYLITGSKEALAKHRKLIEDAGLLHRQLSSMLQQKTKQQDQLNLAASRLQEWYYEVSLRRIQAPSETPTARQNQDTNFEKAAVLISDFIGAMGDLVDTEERALERYRQEVAVGGTIIVWTIWSGFFLGAICMLTVILWIRRKIGRSVMDLSTATEEFSKGNLSARVSGKSNNALARRFNAMADWVQRRNEDLMNLAELGELLSSCKTTDEAIRFFSDFSETLFPDVPGALYLVDPDKVDVRMRATWGGADQATSHYLRLDDCWALRMGRIHQNDATQQARCAHLSNDDVSGKCVPLPAFGEIIGFLFLIDHHKEDGSGGKPFEYMVAQQIAHAFANVRLREMLEQQAIRDPLTQLYNRRHLDEVIKLELYRAQRHSHSLSALVFDIDHFKKFNDEYGHDGGDAVLRHVGDTLRNFFRPEDSAFRSGGEEFVVLLPDTSNTDAVDRAEELRQTISRHTVSHGNTELPPVTISIGVATSSDKNRDAEQLLKAADKALYRAKNEGRNRVVSAAT